MISVIEQLRSKDSIMVCIFSLLAVERLLLIYGAFAKRFSVPLAEFQAIISCAYDLTFHPKKERLDELKTKLDVLIPDTEDYSDVIADQAQCATIGMMYVLEYLVDNSFTSVEYIFQKVEESIDIYSYEGGDKKSVTSKEEAWQTELFEKLDQAPGLNMKEIEKLRQLNRRYAIPHV